MGRCRCKWEEYRQRQWRRIRQTRWPRWQRGPEETYGNRGRCEEPRVRVLWMSADGGQGQSEIMVTTSELGLHGVDRCR